MTTNVRIDKMSEKEKESKKVSVRKVKREEREEREDMKDVLRVERDVVEDRVVRIMDDYKPFLSCKHHSLLEKFSSNHIPFVHFLIFVIWFCEPFQFPMGNLDLYSIYPVFEKVPFHAFLFVIRCSSKDISGKRG
jgi:hypothetical protein